MLLVVATGPTLFAVALDGRPVRFGAPVPAAAVAAGLRLQGQGTLQWRRLPIGGEAADPVWVELAITGPPGTVMVLAGGAGPCPTQRGACYVHEVAERVVPEGRERTEQWSWCTGAVDLRTRTVFTQATTIADEVYAIGEARTVRSAGCDERADVVCRLARPVLASFGVLPPVGGGGATAKAVRAQLQSVLPHLRELPGERGAGDHGRSGGVVTNGEFDTSFALLRLGVGLPDAGAFARAVRAARHLCDRDLDVQTGLPFPHGPDHRSGVPEPGHCWLQGLLWVGLLTADDELLGAARRLGQALATQPPRGIGPMERLRDYAWPLLELEALLQVEPQPAIARAADRYATAIARRFDPIAHTFRFGEGEVGAGVYFERGWLTGGLLLPALRRHLARRPDARLAEQLAAAERMLLDRIGEHGQGLPTHWRFVGDRVFAEHREGGTAEAAFGLDALAPIDLARLLRRSTVRAAVSGFPSPDDPDLPTQLTLLARADWLWR